MSGRFSYTLSHTFTPSYNPPSASPYILQLSGAGTIINGRPVSQVTLTQPIISFPLFDASLTAGRKDCLDSLRTNSGSNHIGIGGKLKFEFFFINFFINL